MRQLAIDDIEEQLIAAISYIVPTRSCEMRELLESRWEEPHPVFSSGNSETLATGSASSTFAEGLHPSYHRHVQVTRHHDQALGIRSQSHCWEERSHLRPAR